MRGCPFVLAACLALAGCHDGEDDIHANVTLLSRRQGALATAAADHLARDGRRAIPTIEAAMHTATATGRKNLIMGLRKIGDVEAVPLLRHLAIYDPSPDVAREADWTLRQWAADKKAPDRADRARQAVRAVEEARHDEAAG
jgi:hypothetical protein